MTTRGHRQPGRTSNTHRATHTTSGATCAAGTDRTRITASSPGTTVTGRAITTGTGTAIPGRTGVTTITTISGITTRTGHTTRCRPANPAITTDTTSTTITAITAGLPRITGGDTTSPRRARTTVTADTGITAGTASTTTARSRTP